jgi:hypothetical protein
MDASKKKAMPWEKFHNYQQQDQIAAGTVSIRCKSQEQLLLTLNVHKKSRTM